MIPLPVVTMEASSFITILLVHNPVEASAVMN